MTSLPVSSSGGAQVPWCLVIFNGTNYRDWVSHMRWHMRGLRLWEFLSGELPYPALPTPLEQSVIPPGTSEEVQKKLREAYDDDTASYMFGLIRLGWMKTPVLGLLLLLVWMSI